MTATESHSEVRPADGPARVIPEALPLQPEDPPRVGEFWLRGRLGANAAGYLYTASDETGRDAVVAMMTEGSADDAAARERFVNAVDELPDDAVLAHNDSDDEDLALWVDAKEKAKREGKDVQEALVALINEQRKRYDK